MARGARALGLGLAMAVVVVLAAVSALAAASPAPRSVTSGVQLEGVSADTATDAWAVGNMSGDPQQGVIFHWDGHSLSRLPSQTQGQLFGVSADSPTDAWAVGSYAVPRAHVVRTVVVHWNGTGWSTVQGPNPVSSSTNSIPSTRSRPPTCGRSAIRSPPLAASTSYSSPTGTGPSGHRLAFRPWSPSTSS